MIPELISPRSNGAQQPLRYLVGLAITALVFLLIEAFFRYEISIFIVSRLVLGLILIVLLLLLLRKQPEHISKSRGLTIAILSTALFFIGGTPLATPMLAITMVMLLKTFGRTACFVCIGVVTFIVFTVHSTTGSSLGTSIDEALRIIVICLLYFLLASVLVALEQERQHSEQLAIKIAENSRRDRDMAVEAERTAAARMLHDGLGQQLVAISMSLGLARNLHTSDTDTAWSEVEHAKEVTDQALTNLRQWVRALDPPATKIPADTEELEETMVAISDAFATTGISFMIRSLGENLPLNPQQGELFQVAAREGVSNALRHGDPTAIRLILETSDNSITLSVVNTTANTATTDIVTGYGLRSIKQRAMALGGTFSAGFTNDGFALVVSTPVEVS